MPAKHQPEVHRKANSPQTITRIPPWRPDDWVKLKVIAPNQPGADLSLKVRRVRSLTCAIVTREQPAAIWRVHFPDGRCVTVNHVDRLATQAEIASAEGRSAGRKGA